MKMYTGKVAMKAPSKLSVHVPPEQERPGRSVYKTERWKQLSAAMRKAVRACQMCGRAGKRLVVDHIVELKDGGDPWSPGNLVCVCWSCHTVKTNGAKRARIGGGAS
jgi:5-methylcytosine-specific restriction endonuclease McrA